MKIQDNNIKVSGSIGISIYPDDGKQSNALIKCADIAMYEAKQKGRNNYQFFIKEMEEKIYRSLQLEHEIVAAIEKEQFILFYQSKVSLETGKIVGAEVLIRWLHPHKGLIYPDAFIDLAERSGLIVKLGDWIVRKACEQQAIWQKEGINLKLAINLSVKQLESIDCVNSISAILKETKVPPQSIEFEITESFSAQNPANIKTIYQLKELGVHIAIDDFGMGYSSLSYLNNLPIDTIKIDKSFITAMLEDANKKAIVEVVLQAAKILKKHTVAEGVETKEVLMALKELGCNEYQGYYFCRPVPLDKFNALLEQQRNEDALNHINEQLAL